MIKSVLLSKLLILSLWLLISCCGDRHDHCYSTSDCLPWPLLLNLRDCLPWPLLLNLRDCPHDHYHSTSETACHDHCYSTLETACHGYYSTSETVCHDNCYSTSETVCHDNCYSTSETVPMTIITQPQTPHDHYHSNIWLNCMVRIQWWWYNTQQKIYRKDPKVDSNDSM